MKFNVNIKNFGKIQNANIVLSNFTVIAGKNGCGKSFVTRAFYSFFNTINKDHLTKDLLKYIGETDYFLNDILSNKTLNKKEILSLTLMKQSIDDCVNFIQSNINAHYLTEQFLLKKQIEEKLDNIINNFNDFKQELGNKKKKSSFVRELDVLEHIIFNLTNLAKNPEQNIAKSIEQDLRFELQENFQLSKLSQLVNYHNNKEFSFDFEKLGTISVQFNKEKAQDQIAFQLNRSSIDEFQQLNNIVYIESPIFWKIRPALNLIKRNQLINRSIRSKFFQKELLGIPKYFFDLSNLLEVNYTLSPIVSKFEKISSNLKSAIGGKFDISESGDIFFKEENCKNTAFSLYLTSTGTTNLGMLSLLLDKGIISDGSYLFIDEPEINLHPNWQKIMVECLLELSKLNVHVVIATHSIDMIKCIELLINKNQDLVNNEHFAINQLSSEGSSINAEESISNKITAIKDDLGESFLQMFLEENG
ncbi:AAA family ATPase [Gilliamella apis]|uniref:Endonuclease GajA/Old nuclease/RecF-like AAA domain-containing protein n=6 Tax=Gilliamella apis TaxID=1970738 RepID=A0A242NW66_9GAMM|nr:AAA family ATPase [Gilliamella apis]OTQ36563.1 hypothetical protein B6C84_02325 [Gilliamella apis]OTQ36949.1 hypothetical protein B6C88_07595 [Gilliamella apis]OTQ45281.1 hypothetical protein B6C86_07995 [Gilliamella apis]OTQ45477.1 hypothetical protein B6C92_11325 [Gilliamella apis]OTQ50893.1 hypothetical protein B6D06_03640 [Gilliamella apis]